MNDPSLEPTGSKKLDMIEKEIEVKANRSVYAVSYLGRRFLLTSGNKKFTCTVALHFWERVEFDNVSKKQTMGVDL